jgi:hypothetical protein
MKPISRPVRPKYLHFEISYSALSGLVHFFSLTRGDALRYAARLPLAFTFRAFGAETNFEAKPLES